MPVRVRRFAALVLLLSVASVAFALAGRTTSTSARGRHYVPRARCGGDRWTVKTLQDRPVLLFRKRTTVAFLVSRPRRYSLPDRRRPFERRVFQVTAPVILVLDEYDKDLHVVVRLGRRHMIVEAPASSCTRKATIYRRRQMARARRAVRVCLRARIKGVAFFDFKDGQTGQAPNAIELHPILGFTCLA
jgi:hypothetical protein